MKILPFKTCWVVDILVNISLCKWRIGVHAIMQFIIPTSQFLNLKKKQAAQSRHPEIQEIHA